MTIGALPERFSGPDPSIRCRGPDTDRWYLTGEEWVFVLLTRVSAPTVVFPLGALAGWGYERTLAGRR